MRNEEDVMNRQTMSAATAAKQRIRLDQRLWKYIRDANSASVADLRKTAIADGKRTYTYGLMFREWERYASVFSAFGMTGENRSRVGLLGSTSAEAIIALYGLNMVGAEVAVIPAYSAFMPGRIAQTIRSEHLTDLIITDEFAQADMIGDLFLHKMELGLKNIIVLHVPVTGVTVNAMLTATQENKYACLKTLYGFACMDNLLMAHGDHPVSYAPDESADVSVILHTSGSTTGTGKPVPLSDRAFNAAAAAFYKMDQLELDWDSLITAVIVDLSNAYSMIDQVHVPFALGATVIVVPGGILNPWFYRAIPEYKISFLFTISAMFEHWIKMPNPKELDFSSLRTVVLGGTSISASDKQRYHQFIRQHGAGDVVLLNGYGISELGGACYLSTRDMNDESIGYPLPGVQTRLLDEETGKFLSVKNAPCEGVLYLNAPSVATLELDGKRVVPYEVISRKPYICTNDLARIEPDGRLTFLGRANRFFLNEEGRKYEAGRVETEMARQAGIESCCVAPVYVKTTHDNIPMLCVKPLECGDGAEAMIRRALRQVFIVEKALDLQNVPSRVMIANELPRNGNGKIDLYKIGRGEVEGRVYTVETVSILGKATDFMLVPYEEGPADMIKEVFDGISAELKKNMPFAKAGNASHSSQDDQRKDKEEQKMNNVKEAINNFNIMNRAGRQFFSKMMGQMNPLQSFKGASFNGMPDMQSFMAGMREMGQKMGGAMPNMHNKAQEAAHNMMPIMQQQMIQMMGFMAQMNQTALGVMQTMFDQNCKLVNQFMEAANGMAQAGAAAPQQGEKPAEPEEAGNTEAEA